MDTLAKSRGKTAERYTRRNALVARNRSRRFIATPFGRIVTADLFIELLAKFLACELEEKPFPAPGDLADAISILDAPTLALTVLAPLLDSIMRGWRGRDTAAAEQKLCRQIGKYLCDRIALERLQKSEAKGERRLAKDIRKGRKPGWKFLKSEWGSRERVAAGFWLMQSAMSLAYFTVDQNGFPAIAPEWKTDIENIRDELQRRAPFMLPHTKPLPDWRGWHSEYDDRLRVTFVRDWHPQTKKAISGAFPFEHADGVNALRRVPFKINQRILPLVERFAAEIMNHSGEQRQADERLVKADLGDAKILGDAPFWLDYNCDTRGRIYPVQHFAYSREDHVRALFNLSNGVLINRNGLQELEMHCAGCEGSTSKKERGVRLQWIDANRRLLERIADDPVGTFELWRNTDKPFCFVAACIDLVAAWRDPIGHVSHLPIGFDASCSGIQHLSLLARDRGAGKLVNLTPEVNFHNEGFSPHDVYAEVIVSVWTALERDDGEWARWWRNRLRHLDPRKRRKLLKRPVMTFAYSATNSGMAEAITEVYRDLFDLNEPQQAAAIYLAKQVREVCRRILRGPAHVMDHIRALAEARAREGRFLEWLTPTAFPVSNRYEKPDTRRIYLTHDAISVCFNVADGTLPTANNTKALNAAAPNFVHSLDSAHLVKTVLAANRQGITDVVTVHDCFACHASHAHAFRRALDFICIHFGDERRCQARAIRQKPPWGRRDGLAI
jgi:DNA-directed RNA polymerase